MPLQMLGLGLFSMWQPVVVAQGNSTAKRDLHWGWILAHDRADAAHVAGYRADLRGDSWRVRRLAW